MRIAGAAYLLWLGMMSWRGAGTPVALDARAGGRGGGFRAGLLTCLTNPQAIAFFVGLFAASAAPDGPRWAEPAVVGGTFVLAMGWYGFVALAFSTFAAR